MQSWISIVTTIGDLLALAAAVTNLATARAQRHPPRAAVGSVTGSLPRPEPRAVLAPDNGPLSRT